MEEIPRTDTFILWWSGPGDERTSRINNTFGQPVLPVSGSTDRPVHPTQEEIDDFLGIPGDISADFVSPPAVPANSFGLIVDLKGQAKPYSNILEYNEIGMIAYSRVIGYNEEFQTPLQLGQAWKQNDVIANDPLRTNQPESGCLISPAGNVLMLFQYGDFGVPGNEFKWGVNIPLEQLPYAWIEVEMKWFPKQRG
jgi:hypothetical protein